MARNPRIIKVSPGSELAHVLDEADLDPIVLEKDGEFYRLHRTDPRAAYLVPDLIAPPQPGFPPLDELAHFERAIRFINVSPAENKRRFYSLSWGSSLFGEPCLIRTYGRLGTAGRARMLLYPNHEHAEKDVVRLIRLRLRHGYVVEQLDDQFALAARGVHTRPEQT